MAAVIVLRELAAEYGYTCPQSFSRKVQSIPGVQVSKERIPGKYAGQAVHTVSPESLELIKKAIGYKSAAAPDDATEEGYFYLIQLLPKLLPGRVKVGFSSNVQSRLMQHRTTSPEAQIIDCWPCKRSWEQAALAAFLYQCGTHHVAGEVFDCLDVNHSLERLYQFFAWLGPSK